MASINYSLKHKGIRLISAKDAWVIGKNKNLKHNPNYVFVGKIEVSMPNMIISANENRKPVYKGSTYDLNTTAKKQIVDHFYDDDGKRNRRTVAYLGIKYDFMDITLSEEVIIF